MTKEVVIASGPWLKSKHRAGTYRLVLVVRLKGRVPAEVGDCVEVKEPQVPGVAREGQRFIPLPEDNTAPSVIALKMGRFHEMVQAQMDTSGHLIAYEE